MEVIQESDVLEIVGMYMIATYILWWYNMVVE